MEIYSTKDQLKEFTSSVIWKDICRELIDWRRSFKRERDSIVDNASETNPSTATVLMQLGDINGRIKTVDYLLNLPRVMLEELVARSDK